MNYYIKEKLETDHQREVVQALETWGWTVYRMNSGRKGGIRLHKKHTPDLLAQRKGRSVWIEMKKPGSEPNEGQLKRHEELRADGFTVLVLHSLDELMEYHKG